MKFDQLGDLAFAGLSLLPFPIFLGGYAEIAGFVFIFLLGVIGVLGWVGQSKTAGKPTMTQNRTSP